MGRPVKWSRDLHPIRERAQRSRTETWSRKDIELLFNVGRATAQTLMKAVGEVQNVAGAHFVERTSLLFFLDEMVNADSIEEELRRKIESADAPPSPKSLRVSLSTELRNVTFRTLPGNITLSAGQLHIQAPTAIGIVEGLALVAQALQNDFEHFEELVEPPPPRSSDTDDELRSLFASLRAQTD